jgi:hypothetical protein
MGANVDGRRYLFVARVTSFSLRYGSLLPWQGDRPRCFPAGLRGLRDGGAAQNVHDVIFGYTAVIGAGDVDLCLALRAETDLASEAVLHLQRMAVRTSDSNRHGFFPGKAPAIITFLPPVAKSFFRFFDVLAEQHAHWGVGGVGITALPFSAAVRFATIPARLRTEITPGCERKLRPHRDMQAYP